MRFNTTQGMHKHAGKSMENGMRDRICDRYVFSATDYFFQRKLKSAYKLSRSTFNILAWKSRPVAWRKLHTCIMRNSISKLDCTYIMKFPSSWRVCWHRYTNTCATFLSSLRNLWYINMIHFVNRTFTQATRYQCVTMAFYLIFYSFIR